MRERSSGRAFADTVNLHNPFKEMQSRYPPYCTHISRPTTVQVKAGYILAYPLLRVMNSLSPLKKIVLSVDAVRQLEFPSLRVNVFWHVVNDSHPEACNVNVTTPSVYSKYVHCPLNANPNPSKVLYRF
jgi:hypothetical protein